MKPSEVGFDGSFDITSGGVGPLKIRLTISSSNPKDWKNPPIDNTFIWLYADPDNPQLVYRNKDGKLFAVDFEPWKE